MEVGLGARRDITVHVNRRAFVVDEVQGERDQNHHCNHREDERDAASTRRHALLDRLTDAFARDTECFLDGWTLIQINTRVVQTW